MACGGRVQRMSVLATRAMVLAAGFGTRLRPLTDMRPKALTPVGGVPILARHLRALALVGIEEVVINVHHHAQVIERYVGDGARFGLGVTYSREPRLTGTGGEIARVSGFFAREPRFLVVNADLYHEFDLASILERSAASTAPATLVVAPHPGGTLGWIGADDGGRVLRVPDMEPVAGLRRWAFTGLHVMTPALLDELPTLGSVLVAYRRLIESRRYPRIDSPEGSWCDIGTPAGLLRANRLAQPRTGHPRAGPAVPGRPPAR